MELALYAPGLGYYSAGSQKFGEAGDFVTAPEISSLFSRCLARQCQQILEGLEQGVILELGAGSGRMASDLLQEMERLNCLPQQYFILEVSAELRERQRLLFQTEIPHLFDRFVWLDRLPIKPLLGVVLANEVLDAMPVHRFQLTPSGEIKEFFVARKQDELVWELADPSSSLLTQQIYTLGIKQYPYESEINLLLPTWLKSLSECLQHGLILLIDYGFPRHEYYHSDRTMGTLMCHYRHRAHTDPLLWLGLQDITAHVDFTLVAESAVAADLHVAGFTTQAAFLLNCGLLNLTTEEMLGDIKQRLLINQQIQKLTSPAEMGELVKVIALTRRIDETNLIGFRSYDQRGRL